MMSNETLQPTEVAQFACPADKPTKAWLSTVVDLARPMTIGAAVGLFIVANPVYSVSTEIPGLFNEEVSARNNEIAKESRAVFLGNKAIHFVFVGTTESEQEHVISVERAERNQSIKDVISSYAKEPENGFTDLRESLNALSTGEYEPKSISWQDSGVRVPLTNDCVTTTRPEEFNKILSAGKKFFQPDAVNIVVTDYFSCGPKEVSVNNQISGNIGRFTGLSNAEGILVSGDGLINGLESVLPHEIGHQNGLPHGAKAFCVDLSKFGGCELKATSDNNTLMSYADVRMADDGRPGQITNAEEYILGLLPEKDLLENPANGTMKISANSYIYNMIELRPSNLPRVIVDTSGASPAYISVEFEIAESSLQCNDKVNTAKGDESVHVYVPEITLPAECSRREGRPIYTYAVQVRTPMNVRGQPEAALGSAETLAVIDTTRNETVYSPNKTLDLLANGYTTPTVLYENKETKYTLVGIDKDGIATINKEAKHLWDMPLSAIQKYTD